MPAIFTSRLRLSALSLAIACALPTVVFAQTDTSVSAATKAQEKTEMRP